MKLFARVLLPLAVAGLGGCVLVPAEPHSYGGGPAVVYGPPPPVVVVPGRTYFHGGYYHRYGGGRWHRWR
jgi:hypothetical protein